MKKISVAIVILAMICISSTASACDPGIDIEKHTNGEDADTVTGPGIPVGATVTWTYYVNNTGDKNLYNVNVIDSDNNVNPTYVSGDDGDNKLEPGEVWVYNATGTATLGQYKNEGKVTAKYWDNRWKCISDTDPSHYIGYDPEIPEFPTIALPIAAIIGLAFIFQRRKE